MANGRLAMLGIFGNMARARVCYDASTPRPVGIISREAERLEGRPKTVRLLGATVSVALPDEGPVFGLLPLRRRLTSVRFLAPNLGVHAGPRPSQVAEAQTGQTLGEQMAAGNMIAF